VLVAVLVVTGSASAAEGPSDGRIQALDERLSRIERLLENQALMDMLQRLKGLEEEVRSLRDSTERLQHQVKQLKERQRELYLDVDERLQALADRGAAARAPDQEDEVSTDAEPKGNAREAYTQAFELLRDGRYQRSIKAFEQFLDDHPESRYAPNARYWLGEAHYATEDYETARKHFARVTEEYPDSEKVDDAKLKLGFALYGLERWERARSVLTEVREMYPDTTVGRLAAQRLKQMRKEGR